jgi:hypothetical protein
MDRFWVSLQGVLVAAVCVFGVMVTGHEAGFPIAVFAAVGLAVWAGFAAWYYARTPARGRRVWRREARHGLVVGVLGFGLPLAVGIMAWRSPGMEGWIFSTTAAAFSAVCIAVIPIAALASSMVDRYLILPRLLGLRGLPIWRASTPAEEPRRRRLAQAWITHRALSELFIFPAIALVLAVALVAAGNALSSDRTLPAAFESLGGASIAIAVFGFAAPRWKHSLRFVLSGPVALGSWVEGVTELLDPVTGMVVDVSVDPGVKIVASDGDRLFVPLALASRLNPLPRPDDRDEAWCRKQVLVHVLKLSEPSAWVGPA